MTKRFRLLMVLPAFVVLGACASPTDPGLPSDDKHDEPGTPGPGQAFNTGPAPVIYA